jgi:hypothetical protein
MSSGSASSAARGSGDAKTFSVWAARKRFKGQTDLRDASAQDRRASSAGVRRARLADRERSDGDAGGHLDDRQQRVHALERLRLDGNAEHGERGFRRGHSREVRRSSAPRDQHLEPARLGRSRVFEQKIGCAMRRYDLHLVRDAEVFQRLGGGLERLPVRARAHDQPHQRLHGRIYR